MQSSWIHAFPFAKEFAVGSTSLMEHLPYNFFPTSFSENYSIASKQWKAADIPHAEEVLEGNYDGVKT